MKARYINPYTDFGFKKIFGEKASKTLIIDSLAACSLCFKTQGIYRQILATMQL